MLKSGASIEAIPDIGVVNKQCQQRVEDAVVKAVKLLQQQDFL